MRLLITTPTEVVLDEADVTSVRAEDESGGFGVLEHHADFLTALAPSVVSWRSAGERRGYCAVRRGILTVTRSQGVAIATHEAILGEDLDHLEGLVRTQFRATVEAERIARTESLQLQMKAMRRIVRYLRPDRTGSYGAPS